MYIGGYADDEIEGMRNEDYGLACVEEHCKRDHVSPMAVTPSSKYFVKKLKFNAFFYFNIILLK